MTYEYVKENKPIPNCRNCGKSCKSLFDRNICGHCGEKVG